MDRAGEADRHVQRPTTLRRRERDRTLMGLLGLLAARLPAGSWHLHGSASLGLLLPGHPREPADLDIFVDDAARFDALCDAETRVADLAMAVVGVQDTPFRPGRTVPPTRSFLVELTDVSTGLLVDRIPIEAQADPRRFALPPAVRPVRAALAPRVLGEVEVQNLSMVLADKFHAYRRRRDGRLNMRWVDLFDTAFVAEHPAFAVSSAELATARDVVLALNPGTELAAPAEPPVEWAAAWRKHRFAETYGGPRPAEALALFTALWDLPAAPSTWSSGERRWRPHSAREGRADGLRGRP